MDSEASKIICDCTTIDTDGNWTTTVPDAIMPTMQFTGYDAPRRRKRKKTAQNLTTEQLNEIRERARDARKIYDRNRFAANKAAFDKSQEPGSELTAEEHTQKDRYAPF